MYREILANIKIHFWYKKRERTKSFVLKISKIINKQNVIVLTRHAKETAKGNVSTTNKIGIKRIFLEFKYFI